MKHIQNYVDKIEAMLAKQSAKESKPRSKGLLAPTMPEKDMNKDKPNELEVIARFVTGIRKAKEEMINGRK
jgi:hypothetical protein